MSKPDSDPAGERANRLAAQAGAAELLRMGIDPRALGLDAVEPPAPAAGGTPHPAGSRAASPAQDGSAPAFRGVAPVSAPRQAQASRSSALDPIPALVSPGPDRPAGASIPPPPSMSAPSAYGRVVHVGPAPGFDPGPEESTLSRPLTRPARPRPAPMTASQQAELLDHVADVPGVVLPAGWRRTVRATTFGVVAPGAAEAMQRERQLVAQVRARPPEPRVIAFLAGKGGVGTTTTAAGVALTLANLRNDTAALVCARRGAGSLGQRLHGQPAPAVSRVTAAGPDAGGPQPLWVRDRLAIFDGAPWHAPVARGELVQVLEDLRAAHPLTLVDIGNELSETAHGALGRADQIVLVTTASQDAVASTRTALSRINQVDPFRLSTVVVALTCLHRRQYRRTARRLRAELGQDAARIVPVPFDAALATGDRLDLTRTRPATREAYLRVAGLIVDPGRPEAWFTQPVGAGAAA